MKLSPVQILDIVHNSLFTSVTPEGEVRFYRFSDKQQKYYHSVNEGHGITCYTTAGVMLDFISDTDTLSFVAEFSGENSQKSNTFDLLIDGVLCQSQSTDSFAECTFSFTLPQGEHRITVVLPWNVATVLRDITIDDGAFVQEVEKGLRIMTLGDSITQGYYADHPVGTYATRTALELNAEILNQGVGGFAFHKDSLDNELCWQPDLIIVAYGTNDYSHYDDFETFQIRSKAYMDRLAELYPDTKILGITPIYRNDEGMRSRLHAKDYTFTEASNYLKALYGTYPNVTVLEGLSFYPRTPDFFVSDYLHPNDLGFAWYAQAVIKTIKEML